MRPWRMTGEPSLDELFDDEIVDRVMQRDGLDVSDVRRMLREMAARIAARTQRVCESCC